MAAVLLATAGGASQPLGENPLCMLRNHHLLEELFKALLLAHGRPSSIGARRAGCRVGR